MASKKASGSTKNGRDSQSKRLGIKLFGGQPARAGAVIVRQRGTVFLPGKNAGMGRDFSIFSRIDGNIRFERLNRRKLRVSVYPPPRRQEPEPA